ncbi:P2Y purinoceptor 13-like [Nothobranchius furzeri]|uniref:P2Y purinoceptor 13-like n=1 Tax=Nothobranchius furzeri TaxID=105023 RepID=A0A9D3BTD5_NOTFU|nr:P2Y purinoceptor 13-like [Nothobranchius furzeri]KAF7219370.1 P2Y purinoceptor 13-like [Nothobranchius furzeri]
MYNNSSHFSSGCTSFSLVDIDVVVACLFLVLFPVALLLNGVALWVSLHLQSLSTFIVYLKNLLMADLLMTMTMPLIAASMLPGATSELKVFNCRYAGVVFYTSMYTSITLMGLISLDRFFKIVQPCGKVLGQNVMFSVIMCSVVWVALFGGTAFPHFILTDQAPNNRSASFCMALKSPAGTALHSYVVALMELLFWLVCSLVVFCYSCITMKVLQSFRNSGSNNRQGKKKTNRRVFLILLVFFVCFVPLHFLRIPYTLYQIFHISVCRQKWVLILHKFSVWVASSNAILDPFLYIYLCKDYREKLIDLMKGCGIDVQR